MEVKVLENKAHRLVFQLVGADHTFCNALKRELNETAGVQVATYAIEHPQVGIPKMLIETKDKVSPQDALDKAVKNLEKTNKEFSSAFSKAK
ncbi:MAG: DNA-directed RNA polymerase subunit L [Nanoarchaeota archaeon]|nr:DNA-directed RNA polymerase subunit L [Nanoarchaeota archaeon]